MASKRRYRALTCALCALAAVVVAVVAGGPLPPDGPLLDVLLKARELVAPLDDRSDESAVAVIALDARSLEDPELARYPRALMAPFWAAILDAAVQAGAPAVGFDLLFTYSANDLLPNFDLPFLAMLGKHRERVVLARSGSTLPALAFMAALRNDEGALGVADVTADADGRYRRVRARYAAARDVVVPTFAGALLTKARGPAMPDEVLLAPRRHVERIPAYAVVDVLRCAKQAPEALAGVFTGRIVVVGGALPEEDRRMSSSRLLTPGRGDARPVHPCGLRRLGASDPDAASVPGVFLHAAAIDAVTSGRLTSTAPLVAVAGLAAATAAGGAALGLAWSPWLAAGAVVVIAALLLGGATAALTADLWVPLALPLAALLAAPALAYVVRYLVEERTRRWIEHAFSYYLSPALVDRLAADPSVLRLGGDRRDVTVMFADLSDFTALSGTVEPEILTRLVNQYLAYIVEEVEATGGYVDKFMGDAVLAIWNAPAPDPWHARHAIRTALAAVARVCRERDAAAARGEIAFSVKIGLNSGPAVVGNVGARRRYNYTAVGETVNVASRLEAVPPLFGCHVVVGPGTAALVEDEYLLRELDWIAVKGRRVAVPVFEPIAELTKATPAQVARVRRFEEALAHYRAMRFVDAYSIWDALAREEGEVRVKDEAPQGPSSKMAERARGFATHPPSPPWDGVWILPTK